MRDTTRTPESCSRLIHISTRFARSFPERPSIRKYAQGTFQDPFKLTTINTKASLAGGELSSFSDEAPVPRSTNPRNLFPSYVIYFRIDISSSIRATRRGLPAASFSATFSFRTTNAGSVNPGSACTELYHLRICD